MNFNVPSIAGRSADLFNEPVSLPDPKRRKRLAASVTLLGCLLGASAVLVSIITQTDQYEDARHLALLPTLFFLASGSLAALIVTPYAIYHLRDNADRPANLLAWIGLGVAFGLTWSLVSGAFTPLTLTLLSYAEQTAGQTAFISQMIDAFLGGIRSMFVQGVLSILTGLLAGALFFLGGFAIDILNARQMKRLSSIGPWAVSIVLGVAVLAFSLFGPPEFLRGLG